MTEKWYNYCMTIKKPMKTVAAAPIENPTPAAGGATIADRFKLDLTDPSAAKKSAGGLATTVAFIAALLALAVSGVLVFILLQHWNFLQFA